MPPLAAASDADLESTQHWLDQECSDVVKAHEFLVQHWMVDWVLSSRTFSGQSILDYDKHPDWYVAGTTPILNCRMVQA